MGNQLSAHTITRLLQALPFGNGLRVLDVSHNALGDVGAEAVATALEAEHSPLAFLQELRLAHNHISAAGLGQVARALARRSQPLGVSVQARALAPLLRTLPAAQTQYIQECDNVETAARAVHDNQVKAAAALAQALTSP